MTVSIQLRVNLSFQLSKAAWVCRALLSGRAEDGVELLTSGDKSGSKNSEACAQNLQQFVLTSLYRVTLDNELRSSALVSHGYYWIRIT